MGSALYLLVLVLLFSSDMYPGVELPLFLESFDRWFFFWKYYVVYYFLSSMYNDLCVAPPPSSYVEAGTFSASEGDFTWWACSEIQDKIKVMAFWWGPNPISSVPLEAGEDTRGLSKRKGRVRTRWVDSCQLYMDTVLGDKQIHLGLDLESSGSRKPWW